MTKLPFNLSNKDGLARKLLDAVVGGAGVQVTGMGLTFLVGVQLARQLGSEGYGIYGTVMALVAMLMVPAQLGMSHVATRDLAAFISERQWDHAKGVLVYFPAVVLLTSVCLCLPAIFAFALLAPGEGIKSAYICGFASIPLLSVASVGIGLLRGLHRVIDAQLVDALYRPAVYALLLLAATISTEHLSVSVALAAQAVASAITLLLIVKALWRETPTEVKIAKAAARWRSWVTAAVPMLGTDVLRTFDGQYSILIFGFLATPHDVGVLRVALALTAFVALPQTIIAIVTMPYYPQFLAKGDLERVRLVASGASLAMVAATSVVTIASAFFGEAAVTFLFGSNYNGAGSLLSVICCSRTVSAFYGAGATALNMTGLERAVVRAFAAGVVVGVSTTVTLSIWFGTEGAAIGLICSEFTKGYMMWRAGMDHGKIDISAQYAMRQILPLVSKNSRENRVS